MASGGTDRRGVAVVFNGDTGLIVFCESAVGGSHKGATLAQSGRFFLEVHD